MRKFFSVGGGVVVFLVVAMMLMSAVFMIWPDVSSLATHEPESTSFIRDRMKTWREEGRHKAIKKTWTPLSRISPWLVKAVIIAEDDAFWSHEGFDMNAIRNAIEEDMKAGKFRYGASTISQQLVKNLYFSSSKNPLRKVAEAIITWRMERALSKKRILELYLNLIEWGDGVFGAEAAARHYFGKPASALTPEEAARLAAIIPSPLRLTPHDKGGYVTRRARALMAIMEKRGVIDPVSSGQ